MTIHLENSDGVDPIFADLHTHDSIFLIAGGWSNNELELIGENAIRYKVPVVTLLPAYDVPGILFSFTTDVYQIGKQASSIASQIINNNVMPGDISVQSAEFFLGVDLATARAIDVEIPSWFVKLARPGRIIFSE